jgi:hypothetical protein
MKWTRFNRLVVFIVLISAHPVGADVGRLALLPNKLGNSVCFYRFSAANESKIRPFKAFAFTCPTDSSTLPLCSGAYGPAG